MIERLAALTFGASICWNNELIANAVISAVVESNIWCLVLRYLNIEWIIETKYDYFYSKICGKIVIFSQKLPSLVNMDIEIDIFWQINHK